MNTEFISSWKRTRGIRHYMAEFNNALIITASLRYCRKSIFTLFYMRSRILNHAIIFMIIRVFCFLHFRAIPSKVLSFYYSNASVGIPGLGSSKLPTGASLNQFRETCESLASPQICCIRLGNLGGEWTPWPNIIQGYPRVSAAPPELNISLSVLFSCPSLNKDNHEAPTGNPRPSRNE